MVNNLQLFSDNPLRVIYKPSELLGMFTSYLSKQDVNLKIIYLRGIYLKNPKHDPRWIYRYDILRDEDTQTEITLQISQKLCSELKDGNLVTVGGVLGKRVQNNSHIQLMLVVSRVEIVQEQVVDEEEQKRIEFRRKKVQIGYKNIDGVLEQKLFIDERPRVALVFAATSITMSDFNAGINAAKSAIDFYEQRVNFANTKELTALLKELDQQKYDVIALVRGGGGGIESLDELDVLDMIVEMQTPIIAAIGHVEEKLFIKQIVDKEAPTPNGLGQYFSDLVETVSEKKNKSRAVLTEQIKKQFQEQLIAAQRQNKELQEKLVFLTKAQEAAQRLHKEQVEVAHRQNQELQKKLVGISKANEAAQKLHKEQVEVAHKQNQELQKKLAGISKANEDIQKAHVEQINKQSKEFNASLKMMQEINDNLNKSLQKLTAQNTQATKDLNEAKERARELQRQLEGARLKTNKGCLSMVVTIITILGVACYAICLIL
ncbi:exodeoxyribonuclease VII large subunit [Bacteroides finegoldii]|jgi:exonuclease VII, large subunit domain protein|uniref:Exonuclease VII large subunit n=1 Tax=Bacteroides finegoldii TaxID=338188 RepID=A0A7J4YP58_9BACE|nr:exodeoxyribonuclease VII large subunit [Bacteroides finegoldii]EEX44292.1 putative Exonuclease VII, large subunit [Bacteroides finegoldii DSM 17565]KAA5216791.1 exonuclease VII large subunit [Bacteroides finegoldii]KAA5221107.1 exonuclease VII large subunit [Bacteroides finegoldii]KAA5225849.1 exonuclease VII large subunit [Bacteroides finegoldii]KAA5230354.1 exonuclease VII large subunit [Bacteroides finegoldii]